MLILDSHVTHTQSLAATEIAREAGVVMVSLPLHMIRRFQPFGGAFFGPFGKYYDDTLRMWMREHVGRPVTTWQVAEILNMAYRKAASIQNAASGFMKAGLWSLTIYVFQDSGFAAATVTNVITEAAQEHNPTPHLTPAVVAPALTAVAMVNAQENNPTPPLTPVVAAPALTAVAMEAVPQLCPPEEETS